ncbi:MAG: hypothetical protein KDA85_22015 [Planctomycetaceae bacterium]|nr:hypothetical protein [Planctomycetaceae bacterium]
MGFFDALFGRKKKTRVEVIPDRIWMTTAAKFRGVAREAADRSHSETVAILLVAHFPDVLVQLEEICEQWSRTVLCRAVLAENLDADLAAGLNLNEAAVIDVIVAERHPIPAVDDQLEQVAESFTCRCRFSHHLSLDDPVIEFFAGDWVRNVLQKLGMTEDEPIESAMVSRRIRQAQQAIAGRTTGNQSSQSAGEWLQRNCEPR